MYAQVIAVINQLSSNFEQTVLKQKVRKALAKRLHEYLPLFFGKVLGRGPLKFWFLEPQRVLFENILLSYMLNRNFTEVLRLVVIFKLNFWFCQEKNMFRPGTVCCLLKI